MRGRVCSRGNSFTYSDPSSDSASYQCVCDSPHAIAPLACLLIALFHCLFCSFSLPCPPSSRWCCIVRSIESGRCTSLIRLRTSSVSVARALAECMMDRNHCLISLSLLSASRSVPVLLKHCFDAAGKVSVVRIRSLLTEQYPRKTKPNVQSKATVVDADVEMHDDTQEWSGDEDEEERMEEPASEGESDADDGDASMKDGETSGTDESVNNESASQRARDHATLLFAEPSVGASRQVPRKRARRTSSIAAAATVAVSHNENAAAEAAAA